MHMISSRHIETVIEILKDEVLGRVKEAIEKTHPEYKMIWAYKTKSGELFPSATMGAGDTQTEEIYKIEGRVYEIMNIAESGDAVMVELIESYPDPKTGQMYRTPLVLVLEFEDGKIKNGRHYCDPRVSYEDLSAEQISVLYRDKKPIYRIENDITKSVS